MMINELTTLVQAACPILGIDSSGGIQFDPTATLAQQQAARDVIAANLPKLNGQSSRQSNDIANIFTYLKNNATAAQQANVNLLCSAVVLSQYPALAARINQQTGLAIPYDQANPNG